MVVKLYGTNSSTVIEQVENKLIEINKMLPDGVTIVPYYEQKSLVQAAVKTVSNALVQGIILVSIILLVFMGGFRPSLVVAASIPFSVLFAFLLMGRFNISANLMSLGGLAIAIGMMVDGTIVMVENIDRSLRESSPDDSKMKVIASSCLEVGRPILFAISIIIIVFLPLFTLQGVEGKTFKPLAYTVSFAMLGSLIFAVALAPVLSALVMRRKNKTDSAVVKILQKPYKPLVSFFVNKSWLALSVAVVLLVIGAFLFPKLGSEFTPELNEGTIVVRMTMAPSISLTESTRMVQIVERRLLTIPDVQEIVTRIGRGEIGAHADPINSAEVFVILNQNASDNIEDIIRHKIDDIPGILFNLTQPIETTIDELLEGVRAELAIKIFGDDLDELKIQADKIASVVKEVPGAADIQVDQVSGAPQLLIRIDRKAIARYGINVADVQSVIHAAVGGEVAGQIFEGVRRFDIMVRYELNARDSAVAIGNILINGPDGLKVPLDELATIEEIVGNRQITRENNQRFISIQCNVVDRDIGSFVKEAQSEIDHDIDLPAGYMVTWGGQFRLQQEANKRLALVVPFTLLAVFLLLLSSFGSIKNTLLILLNIPLALVGGIAALCFSGQNLSVPASVGFIALFGIALENGMVLVTCINQLVKKGMSVNEAAIMGACLRLRPVLMTALTTALGLIPLLIATGTGSEVQRPLATVVIGGLITSTILTLLVIPALFRWFKAK